MHAILRERQQRDAGQQKDNRQCREQNIERDFVGSLLPLGPFDQRDHAIEKRFAGVRADAARSTNPKDARAAGDAAAVATAFADHGALSPVMALSSTEAMPSITSPSAGTWSPASTRMTSPLRSAVAET